MLKTSPTSSTASNAACLVAILATSLAFGPALAHALELLNKINLSRDDYFVVQQIYAGWSLLGAVILVEALSVGTIMIMHWGEPPVRNNAAAARAAVIAALAVFWIWTFPANQETSNWTAKSDNWENLRAQWEFSHLAGAGLQFCALTALTIAVLRRTTRVMR